MENNEKDIFASLIREVCEKCFAKPLVEALTEPDAKRLSDEILERTGLVIGWKSIKNFSKYATHSDLKKEENPSTATLDTLARYVMNAAVTNELKRRSTEAHFPYWYEYKGKFVNRDAVNQKNTAVASKKVFIGIGLLIAGLATFFVIQWKLAIGDRNFRFVDDFNSVGIDSLIRGGWILKKPNDAYWNKRKALSGHLALYTLQGDNWNDRNDSFAITNLLIRKIDTDCFSTEIHLTNFLPNQNWQQAGILLSEDSTFSGRALRLSLAYKDFFGGYDKPSEIIVQVVGSHDPEGLNKPEEIAHVVLFTGDVRNDSLIRNNLSKSALRIEKLGNDYRFLFTNGRMESFAFKEVAHRDFDIKPKYLALFAMQGLSESENPIPVFFDSFNLIGMNCD